MENLKLNSKKAYELTEKYGSPLYVYDEEILRKRCKEIKNLIPGEKFKPSFSSKANDNIELLRIIKDEGINADAMSPGEILIQEKAGYRNDEIFYIGNNVCGEEMKFAIDRNILVSVDSVSQLKLFGSINRGGKVSIRINPGMGVGHNEKVVTAGDKSKFGIQLKYIEDVKAIAKEYDLKIIGINQHIGSLFLEDSSYIEACKVILNLALEFPDLEFVDFGGGFGVPYNNEKRLDLNKLTNSLCDEIKNFKEKYKKDIVFKVEPGRYLVAECGMLLGTVNTIKMNFDNKYIGTDLGFNVLMRPVLYDSKHFINVYSKNENNIIDDDKVIIVGNICESGDIIGEYSNLPKISEGDILGIENAGAYGYSMASNYNARLRPAEVLIKSNGEDVLIRKRDTYDIVLNQL